MTNCNYMTKNNYIVWEKHKPYIEQISKVNNSFVFVLELGVQCLFVSDNFCDFFGYDREKLLKDVIDFDYLKSYMHPDDEEIFELTQKNLLEYMSGLPKDTLLNYKHIYEFRVSNIKGKYIRMISQHQALEVDEHGNPWLILGIMDISPEQSPEAHIKLRLANFKTNEVVSFPISIKKHDVVLTPREKEVLEMIKNGFLSKEISEKLSISIHTVNNHRRNILEKMNADNALEAINFARKLGLLD